MMGLTIGAAADATGVKVTTIRFYETRGMMPEPDRTASGRRVYAPSQVARLKFIKHARALGFDLDDIAALLDLSDDPTQDCGAADSMARNQIAVIEHRMALLQNLHDELTRMVRTCHGGKIADCRVIESLADHRHCAHPRHDMA